MPFQRVPLAWKNLTHEPARLMVAVTGVGFAVFLMFIEIGFYNAAFDSPTKLLLDLDADLVVVGRGQYSLIAGRRFPEMRLHQARACPGVRSAAALYLENNAVLRRHGRKGFPIRIIAFDPAEQVFAGSGATEWMEKLRMPQAALVDRRAREVYKFPETEEGLRADAVELEGKEIRLVGKFELASDLANDGNLLMSDHDLALYFPHRAGRGAPLSVVDLGLIRIRSGSDAETVREAMRERLPGDVEIYTRDEFVRLENDFWAGSVPVAYIFLVGAVMGFVVGVVICYQIIYTDACKHIPEFATLKAMGYRPRFFYSIMLGQSLYLALIGFVPGALVGAALYGWLGHRTGLVMALSSGRLLLILTSTVAMCMISGGLAIRKVLSADPAELF